MISVCLPVLYCSCSAMESEGLLCDCSCTSRMESDRIFRAFDINGTVESYAQTLPRRPCCREQPCSSTERSNLTRRACHRNATQRAARLQLRPHVVKDSRQRCPACPMVSSSSRVPSRCACSESGASFSLLTRALRDRNRASAAKEGPWRWRGR
jgi:hypothetical protein